MTGLCRICEAPAPFGYGEPGPRSQRKRTGYVWSCAAHRPEVEALWRDALGLKPRKPAPAIKDPAQPSLF